MTAKAAFAAKAFKSIIVALIVWTLGCTIQTRSTLRESRNHRQNVVFSTTTMTTESTRNPTTMTGTAAKEAQAEAIAGIEQANLNLTVAKRLVGEEAAAPAPAPPKHKRIKENQAVMLHVGKAGGGTFDLRSKQWWHVTIEKTCHPQPCLHASFDLADENYTTVLIDIRDPVDRFVSAFYWRVQLWCHPHKNETRIPGGPATRFPDLYCGNFRPPERKVLFQRYRENANLLAESLCNDDSNMTEHKNTNKTMMQAAKDLREIGHLLAHLPHWVGPDWLQKRQTLYPIVLEHGFSLEQQIDNAMRYLQSRPRPQPGEQEQHQGGGIDKDPLDFQARQDYVVYMDQQVKLQQEKQQHHHQPAEPDATKTTTALGSEPSTLTAVAKIQKYSHSSSRSKIAHIPLSPRGERCATRHYEHDYHIIRDMVRYNVCKDDICQAALQSILNRRAHHLGWDDSDAD